MSVSGVARHPALVDVVVRPLDAANVDAAEDVFRDAFSTVLGAGVHRDIELLRTRFRARHTTTLGAFADDAVVGSTVVTRWGSVAYFGPLSVTPKWWGEGICGRSRVRR